MMWIDLFILFLLLLSIFLGYEVIGPYLRGAQLFPHFRKSTWTTSRIHRAELHLAEARAQLQAAEIEAQAKKVEDAAKQLNDDKKGQ